jgi:hypothetical protein
MPTFILFLFGSASDFAGSGHVFPRGTSDVAADPRRQTRFDV